MHIRLLLFGAIGFVVAMTIWPQGAGPSAILTAAPMDRLLLGGCLVVFVASGCAVLLGLFQLYRTEHAPGERRSTERRKGDRRRRSLTDKERREVEHTLLELGHDRRRAERRLAERRDADRLEVERILKERSERGR